MSKGMILSLLVLMMCLCGAVRAQELENVKQIAWTEDDSAIVLTSDHGVREVDSAGAVMKSLSFPALSGDAGTILDYSAAGDVTLILDEGRKSLTVLRGSGDEAPLKIPAASYVMDGSLSPDGTMILVYYADMLRADCFALRDGQLIRTFEGFQTAAPVFDVKWSADGKYVVWHSRGHMQAQSLEDGSFLSEVNLWDFIMSYDLSPDGLIYAAALGSLYGNGSVLELINGVNGGEIAEIYPGDRPVTDLHFDQSGEKLYVSTQDELVLVDLRERAVVRSESVVPYGENGPWIRSFSVTADGDSAALLMTDGSIRVLHFAEVVTK